MSILLPHSFQYRDSINLPIKLEILMKNMSLQKNISQLSFLTALTYQTRARIMSKTHDFTVENNIRLMVEMEHVKLPA